jgi:RNA 2',3'-cyclic 3'-phosphodiesterase
VVKKTGFSKTLLMKRLFFALWSDETIRQQCVKIGNAVLAEKAQPVQTANIHVTLLFLGNIDSDKEQYVKEALATVPVPKITLCFDKLSFWKKPSVLCLTSTNPNPELEGLVETLSKVARKLDIPLDERPFKPHVTLVKKATKLTPLSFKPIIWQSNSFCLVESCRIPSGIEYRIVEKWGAN